ncbi:MAG: hypothetical protein WB509_29540 [Acetobacteraceae bacterium]|jgi:integrase
MTIAKKYRNIDEYAAVGIALAKARHRNMWEVGDWWNAASRSGETPIVLRHSFASPRPNLGNNEPTIASLLGHKTHSITSRYMHSADAVLLAAADAVANATMKLMGEDSDRPVD